MGTLFAPRDVKSIPICSVNIEGAGVGQIPVPLAHAYASDSPGSAACQRSTHQAAERFISAMNAPVCLRW